MDSQPDGQPQAASKAWTIAFGVYLVILNLLLLYLLLRLWPGQVPLKADDHNVIRFVPGMKGVSLWIETRYLLLVAVTGALGSYIHLATSFADFLGNRQFVKSWCWWYVLRPFIGMALAIMFYFAARGGLIAGTTGAESLSPFGVAAMSGLAGMFSKQATDKLREVFENLFKTASIPPRGDSLKHPDELLPPGRP
jgi:hypothetical protein